MAIGTNVRYWRERRSYGQGELATLVGITQNSLWRIEAEHRRPRPSTLRKIAEALKVDVDQLTAPDAPAGHAASGARDGEASGANA